MLSFEMFLHKMQKNSEEKIKYAVFANWYGNTLVALAICLVLYDLVRLVAYVNYGLFIFLYFLILFLLFFYIETRKAGLALTENRYVYIKFKHIGYREKEVFEIPFENIRSITTHKFLNLRIVKMSFISNIGKLEKIKFVFNTTRMGIDKKRVAENSLKIYEELEQLQKVLDRGDF